MSGLSQHRGPLSAEQIAEGMSRALANAERLAADAALLYQHGRAPSAIALSILSIEESGKIYVLRQLAIAADENELQTIWKAYRSHTKKNVLWLLGELVRKGAKKLDEFAPLADPGSDHPEVLDRLKQLCFYTDCFRDGKWSSPDDVDGQTLAPYLLKMAEILGRAKTVTALEVQLWQKHLLPVKDAPMEAQKAAVAAWFHEMVLRGLSNASTAGVEDFLGSNIAPTQT